MNLKEALRQARQAETLQSLGFTSEEAESLRRISMTLRRWYEEECNGTIQRDEEIGSPTEGKPIRWTEDYRGQQYKCGVIPDRETGARKRLARILETRNERMYVQGTDYYGLTRDELSAYIQTDPRGAALYILRPGDVPDGADVSSYYTRGICVY